MVTKPTVRHSGSHGQSLVLVALMAIVLVGFVGLAIDGGVAFSQRRAAQNAADGASLRGAYLMRTFTWRQQTDETAKRNALLTTIHAMAELHGVPDTNGIAGDEENANITAYYRDADGDVPKISNPGEPPYLCPNDCPVIGTSPIPANAWGVELDVRLPFDSYFVGVIGLNEITVAAQAVGVAHVGPTAANSGVWMFFAKNEHSCDAPGDSSFAIDLGGVTNKTWGNIHSNGDIRVDASDPIQINQPFNAEMSYRSGGVCEECTGNVRPVHEVALELPSFEEYYTLADQQTRITGVGTRYEGLPTPPGYIRPTLVFTGTRFGDTGAMNEPYVFVDGDLVLQRTDTTTMLIGGLIVVNGNVTIAAPKVQSLPLGVSILARGQIQTIAPSIYLNIVKPYQSNSFDPLLRDTRHVVALWSDAEYSGSDACTIPAITLPTIGWTVKGAVMAPDGYIDLTSPGTNKQVNGTVIADTIKVDGGGQNFVDNRTYFPPQPDIVELME